MNYFASSALFVGLSSLFSALIVLWKNPKGEKNLLFQPAALSVVLWSFFYALWQLSETAEAALFFIRISIACAAFIPPTNFHLTIKILDAETPRRNKFRIFFYGVSFLIVLSSFTQYFIPRVEPRHGFPFWPVPGPFIHLHFINLFIPSLWATYLIWEKKEKASPLNRNKLKWLLVGYVVGYAGGMTNNFLWYGIPVKPYLSIFSSVGCMMVAATFFQLALVDFNYLLKKSLFYMGNILFTVSLVSLPVIFSAFYFSPVTLILMAAALAAVLQPFIHHVVEILVNRFFMNNDLHPNAILKKAELIKESTYTYADLAHNMVDLTMNTFSVEMSAVYFYDERKQDFYLCNHKGMKNPLVHNLRYNRSGLALLLSDPLVVHIQTTQEAVNVEALLNDKEDRTMAPLIESMHRIEGEICAPLIFGGRLRGLMVIGRKKNNTLFDRDEVNAFLAFSQMGSEIMRTIMAMESELNHNTYYSHDMNHNIRSLTQTLQFLRTPLAQKQSNEKIQKLLQQAENVAERLYESFQSNQDRSALILKTLRGEYEKSQVDLAAVVSVSTGKFILQAEKTRVDYKVTLDPTTTKIMGNEMDLIRMLDNLISNAFRYLPVEHGLLEISGQRAENSYQIHVKDNGEGLEPENLDQIWKSGWQGRDSRIGTGGFGLAIVKQIVQIHGGTIEAFSQGKGTGMSFHLNFPLRVSEENNKNIF